MLLLGLDPRYYGALDSQPYPATKGAVRAPTSCSDSEELQPPKPCQGYSLPWHSFPDLAVSTLSLPGAGGMDGPILPSSRASFA